MRSGTPSAPRRITARSRRRRWRSPWRWIQTGLVVLVVNQDDQQVIFANVAGVLDLAAIEKLGEELDIPGFDELD